MEETKKTLGNNPKDRLGVKKYSTSKLPVVGIMHGAHAMMNGADKYGPYNWRENAVIASIYIDAIQRHIQSWQEGEELAADSLCHHLGHIIADASILLDAMATGNLIDDRPKGGAAVILAIDELNQKIKRQADEKKLGIGQNSVPQSPNQVSILLPGSQPNEIANPTYTGIDRAIELGELVKLSKQIF